MKRSVTIGAIALTAAVMGGGAASAVTVTTAAPVHPYITSVHGDFWHAGFTVTYSDGHAIHEPPWPAARAECADADFVRACRWSARTHLLDLRDMRDALKHTMPVKPEPPLPTQ